MERGPEVRPNEGLEAQEGGIEADVTVRWEMPRFVRFYDPFGRETSLDEDSKQLLADLGLPVLGESLDREWYLVAVREVDLWHMKHPRGRWENEYFYRGGLVLIQRFDWKQKPPHRWLIASRDLLKTHE